MIAVKQDAPDFTLEGEDGKSVTLSSFRGHYVVLYFYPKDGSMSCIYQAKEYRNHYAEFEKEGAEIIGISRDSKESHNRFKKENGLPFILLSDPQKAVLNLYEVWQANGVPGTTRSSFLIAPNGKIVAIEKPADPLTNATHMLEALKKDKEQK